MGASNYGNGPTSSVDSWRLLSSISSEVSAASAAASAAATAASVAAASVAQNLGKFISVVIPQPALGAGAATVKVPAGFQWRVKGCKATLTTGATAGNRNVAVQCSDAAGNQMSQAFSSYVHPKSTAVAYTFGPGLLNTTTAIFFAMSSTMCEMDLGPGASFQVAVVGIQATDQLSLITLMVESIAVS